MPASKILRFVLLALCFFSLGYFSTQYKFFNIEKSINVLDLLTFIITTVIGVYLVLILEPRMGQRRTEKDILISRINKLEETLEKIEELIESDNPEFKKIVGLFKKAGMQLPKIHEECELAGILTSQKIIVKQVATFNRLKRIATGGETKDGNFIFSGNELAEIRKYDLELKKRLFEMIIEVNRNG